MAEKEWRTVKVASVEIKNGGGENGSKSWTKYTLVDGNGNKASTFDGKIGKFLQDHNDKQIDVVTEQSGKFTNLNDVREHVEEAPKAANGGNGYYQRDPDSEMRIAREACLKAAVSLHGPAEGTHFEESGNEVIRMATRFQHWVYTGETPELTKLLAPKPLVPSGNGGSAPTPIAFNRVAAINETSRLFNLHPEKAMEFLAGQGWPATIARLDDEQLRQLRDHLQHLTSVPA